MRSPISNEAFQDDGVPREEGADGSGVLDGPRVIAVDAEAGDSLPDQAEHLCLDFTVIDEDRIRLGA